MSMHAPARRALALRLLPLLDLTSLGEDDTPAAIRALCASARLPAGLPAALCRRGDMACLAGLCSVCRCCWSCQAKLAPMISRSVRQASSGQRWAGVSERDGGTYCNLCDDLIVIGWLLTFGACWRP